MRAEAGKRCCATVLKAWAQLQRCCARGRLLSRHRAFRRLATSFLRWEGYAKSARVVSRMGSRNLRRQASRLLGSVLREWRRVCEELVRRREAGWARQRLSAAFMAWSLRAETAQNARLHRFLILRESRMRRLSRCFDCWRAVAALSSPNPPQPLTSWTPPLHTLRNVPQPTPSGGARAAAWTPPAHLRAGGDGRRRALSLLRHNELARPRSLGGGATACGQNQRRAVPRPNDVLAQ